jgi:hypothetical protein
MLKIALLCVLACACLEAQPAALEGIAVNAATGTPLAGVHVSLLSVGVASSLPEPDDAYGAISDASGHYSIRNIRPGAYYLNPTRSGFVWLAAPTLTLSAAQQAADYKIPMTPEAVIRGRVLDEFGDPMPGVSVRAVSAAPTEQPQASTMRAETDDRGEYRIHGVPGSYYVEAAPRAPEAFGAPEIRTDGTLGTPYAVTYYPASLARGRGQTVDATSAHELTGIDIHVARYHPVKITGTVLSADDAPVRGVVTLRLRDEKGEASQDILAGPDGSFTFEDLAPAEYQVQAKLPPQREGDPPLASPLTPVIVESQDVSVRLTVTAGEALAGAVTVEDRQDEALAAWTVYLRPTDPHGDTVSGQVAAEGSFALVRIIPGVYRVSLETLPGNDYIRSVKFAGVHIPGDLDLSKGVGRSMLEIQVARDGGEISGTIGDDQSPAAGRRLLVVLARDPNAIDTWRDVPTMDAKFTLHGVRPGKYRLFAVDPARFGGLRTLDPLKAVALRADELEVESNGRLVRHLQITGEVPDAK